MALVLALLLLPCALAGNEYGSDAPDATGWNTQRKMVREADGALDETFTVPARDNASRTEVVVERLLPNGTAIELPRPAAARGDISRSTLTLDGQGRLWAAWTEVAQSDREVFVARYDGARWTDITQLSGGSGYAGFPSLATDKDGRPNVAWYGFDGHNYQTYYRRLDASGWSAPDQLSAGTLDANNPSVVVDAEGGVHVAWYKSDGVRYHAWYAHRAPGAAAWDLPYKISTGDGEALNAALVVDRAGNVHAAWDELRADGYWVMHAVRAPGGNFSAPEALARGDVGNEYPALAAWGDGVVVAWSAPNGTLVGTDLHGAAPRPILGGNVAGRLPSLRGPSWWPASERVQTLDIMFTTSAGEVRHVAVGTGPGCSLFAKPCDAALDASAPAWTLPPAGPRAVPLPALVALAALTLAAGARHRRAG